MHTSERRPLVSDPEVPGASLLVSRECLAEWLTDTLGGPCSITMRRVRYKPGTSVVLGFDLTWVRHGFQVTEPCIARAYADHARAKLSKTLETVQPDALLAYDTRRGVVVTTAAGDRALPLLPRLARPDGMTRLLERVLPDHPGPDEVRLRTVRHNPERRWVGLLERDGAPSVLIRAYHGGRRAAQAADCYASLAHSLVPTPPLLGRSRSLAVAAVAWTEGTDLGGSGSPSAWRAAGTTLARLHESTGLRLRTSEPSTEAAAVERTGRAIAGLLPERAADVRRLARGTARLLEHLPRDHVPLHGDFSSDQVVIGVDGVPTLIDLDSAHFGASAADVGCLTASTLTAAEAADMGPRGDREVAALMGGYEEVRRAPDPFAVGVHAVAYRLRKAIDPFRDCELDWHAEVDRRIDRASAALENLSGSGARR